MNITGPVVSIFILKVLRGEILPSIVAEALLVIIPKVEDPINIIQFCPISLCNVAYKIIPKVIANRVKVALDTLVSPFRTSFIPGCHSTDNVIVCQEIIHSISKIKELREEW